MQTSATQDSVNCWEKNKFGIFYFIGNTTEKKGFWEQNHLFENKKHALFCKNDLSDLCQIIDYYLAHPEEANEIAREGQKHLLKFHTHLARAQYLFEIVETKLKIFLK